MALCERCAAFDVQSFARAPYQTLHYSLATTIAAAKRQNCSFCRLILHALRPAINVWRVRNGLRAQAWINLRMTSNNDFMACVLRSAETPLLFNRLDAYIGSEHQFSTRKSVEALELEGSLVSFRVLADEASVAHEDIAGIYLGQDSSNDQHFQIICQWLQSCIETHPKCRSTMSGSREIHCFDTELPTRCIQVDSAGIRLRKTSGERGAYITLSHRWLPETYISNTTVANLADRLAGMDESSLSRTFQDAIFVVRKLNSLHPQHIFYLWIDSLCIVQSGDDQRDWKAEAAQMGKYYQQSVFTIAATDSSSSGFLVPGTADESPLVRLPYRNKNSAKEGYFYIQPREYGADANTEYHAYITRSELLQRGWVFQECLLSRRVLYYSQGRVFFECQTAGATNRFGESIHSQDGLAAKLANSWYPSRRIEISRIFSQVGKKATSQLWTYLVEEFSKLTFSEPKKDRIIALAGIAGEFRDSMLLIPGGRCVQLSLTESQRYMAGCWEQYIHEHLLWEPKIAEKTRRSACEASTWSWAAWSCPVHWRSSEATLTRACKIESVNPDAHLTAADASMPTSSPIAGFDGPDNTFTRLIFQGKTSVVLIGPRLGQVECEMMAVYTGVAASSTSRWRALLHPDQPDLYIGWADYEPAEAPVATGGTSGQMTAVLALHIVTQEGVEGGLQFGYWGLTHEVYGIILIHPVEESTSTDQTIFERAGVGRIFQKHFFRNKECLEGYLI